MLALCLAWSKHVLMVFDFRGLSVLHLLIGCLLVSLLIVYRLVLVLEVLLAHSFFIHFEAFSLALHLVFILNQTLAVVLLVAASWLLRSVGTIWVVGALIWVLKVGVRVRYSVYIRLRWGVANVKCSQNMATVDATAWVITIPNQVAGVVVAIVLALVRATCVLLVVRVHGFLVLLVRHLVLSFSVTSHRLLDLAQLIILIILVSTCSIGWGVLSVTFL